MAYPNRTMYKCTDGQSPQYSSKYVDGNRPVISSFNGTIANGQPLTLGGIFSAKRNGDLFNRIVTPAQAGQEIVPSYLASTSDSFIGTGACLLSETTLGNQWKAGAAAPIITHEPITECHFSYLFRLNFINYGASAEQLQIKFPRCMVHAGHEGALGPIIFFAETDAGLTLYLDSGHKFQANWAGSAGTGQFIQSGTQLTPLFNQWCSVNGYYKVNSAGKIDGCVFQIIRNETTGEVYFDALDGSINGNDQRRTGSIPVFSEQVFRFDALGTQPAGTQFWLFFFKRGSTVVNCFMDGLIVNDSPESVWLMNNPDPDVAFATGKRIQIPQNSRSSTQIVATAYLGNMTTADNIYCFVKNSNGRWSNGMLVRAAA